ncbi:predicted protein [Naegleria gruberi]|uniref:Predicted protein n=1 Tax=Naegleria gruberi TaxID=5762 RepID=D2VG42_NAEGR|nr:uncharacterized protein NAEGRDRAFT_58114 [Naegleria gruberi]EFC44285.1 predicted protein [Naegleria gruberi]|eukprot:XP_002677029.1 predicted protein [Naegleria gruberi strain NEG-M]
MRKQQPILISALLLVVLLIVSFMTHSSLQQSTGSENPMYFDGAITNDGEPGFEECPGVVCLCGKVQVVNGKCVCPDCPNNCPTGSKDCTAECANKGLLLESISKDSVGCDQCICKCKTETEACPLIGTCDSRQYDITYGTVGGISGCITNCTCKPPIVIPPPCVNATSCDQCNSVLGYDIVLNQTTGCNQCSCKTCPTLNCAASCLYGFTLSDSGRGDGCQVCNCSCPPTPKCESVCPYGYIIGKDANGCDACSCNPPPACTPDDASKCNTVTCPYGGSLKNDQYGCPKCVCYTCPEAPISYCQANCPYGYVNTTQTSSDGARCPTCECLRCPVVNIEKCNSSCVYGGSYAFDPSSECNLCKCNKCPPSPPDCQQVCGNKLSHTYDSDSNGCPVCKCTQCPAVDCDAVQCPYGYQYKYNTDTGCRQCVCNQPPVCPTTPPDCTSLNCPNGYYYTTDSKGCQSCKCNDTACPQPEPDCIAQCTFGVAEVSYDSNKCKQCKCLEFKCPPTSCADVCGSIGIKETTVDEKGCTKCTCNTPPVCTEDVNCRDTCGTLKYATYRDNYNCTRCKCYKPTCPDTLPICEAQCGTLPYEMITDDSGCDMCRCIAPPTCPQPEPDCIAQCTFGVAEVSYNANGCKQCKCLEFKCPPTNCGDVCGSAGIKETTVDERGCTKCTCNTPPVCADDVNCRDTCGTLKYVTYRDNYNCTRCRCIKPTCPDLLPNCSAICGSDMFEMVKDANGCDQCKCKGEPIIVCPPIPDCNDRCGGSQYFEKVAVDNYGCKYCQCKNCVQCKCCKSKKITIPIVKHVPKRVYIPYTVWYDPAFFDKVKNNFQTKEEVKIAIEKRYNYIVVLRKKITIYRRALVNLRIILKQLVIKKKISASMFKKADEMARKRKKLLEEQVKEQTICLTSLDNHIKAIVKLIKQLGYNTHAPAVCAYVAGTKRCGLRPSFINELVSSYLKDNVFTKIIYTKIPTSVSDIDKDLAGQTIRYTRTSATWKVQVIKLNKRVKNAVWKIVLKQVLKNGKKVKRTIKKILKIAKKNKETAIRGKKAKKIFIRKVLMRRFRSRVVRAARKALATSEIKQLNEQFKPTSTERVIATRVTQEIMYLPKDILSQSDEILKALLSQKYAYTPLEDKKQYE